MAGNCPYYTTDIPLKFTLFMYFYRVVEFIFKFPYKAIYNQDFCEHELDHVFQGYHNGSVHSNHQEVADFTFDEYKLLKDIKQTNICTLLGS